MKDYAKESTLTASATPMGRPVFSIGAKFTSLILLALVLAVSIVVFNATTLFQKDNLNNIYTASDLLTSAKAGEVRAWANGTIQKGTLIGKLLAAKDEEKLKGFESDSDILSATLFVQGEGTDVFAREKTWINPNLAKTAGASLPVLEETAEKLPIPFAKVASGAVHVMSHVLPEGQPLFAIVVPFGQKSPGVFNIILSVVTRQEKLLESFSDSGAYTLSLVDAEGRLLAHPDVNRVTARESLASLPIVSRMLQSTLDREFQEFRIGDEDFLGSYAKVGIGGIGVISQIPRARAFEAARTLIKRSVLITVLVLSLSFVIAYLFVQTMISPIRNLSVATHEVAKGNFDIRVQVKTRDELKQLGDSFNTMSGEIKRLMAQTADKARMEKELETAKHVQDTMFPPAEIRLPNTEIQSYYTPAGECGGDWWGRIELPDGKILLAIGDATGHGVPAAMVTATAKAACSVIHHLAKTVPQIASSPGQVLEILNKAIYESTAGKILMTFFVAVCDPKTGSVTYATASHDPIYWYKMPADATPENGSKNNLDVLLSNPGPRLGQGAEATYEEGTARLNPRDLIILYTDGLPEGKNPAKEEYGERKFLRSMGKHAHKTPAEVRAGILADFREFIQNEPLHDDVTLVVYQHQA